MKNREKTIIALITLECPEDWNMIDIGENINIISETLDMEKCKELEIVDYNLYDQMGGILKNTITGNTDTFITHLDTSEFDDEDCLI